MLYQIFIENIDIKLTRENMFNRCLKWKRRLKLKGSVN